MRRILIILCTIFIGFTSCKKDDISTKTLESTQWEQIKDEVLTVLTFHSKTNCQIVITSPDNTDASVRDFSYEYNYPNVKFYPKQSVGAELKGIIEGNIMNIINVSTGHTISCLTRKITKK